MQFQKVNNKRVAGTSDQRYSHGIAGSVYFTFVLFHRGSPWNVLAEVLCRRIELFPSLFVDIFLPPFPLAPSLLLAQCDGCLEDCVGAHG